MPPQNPAEKFGSNAHFLFENTPTQQRRRAKRARPLIHAGPAVRESKAQFSKQSRLGTGPKSGLNVLSLEVECPNLRRMLVSGQLESFVQNDRVGDWAGRRVAHANDAQCAISADRVDGL